MSVMRKVSSEIYLIVFVMIVLSQASQLDNKFKLRRVPYEHDYDRQAANFYNTSVLPFNRQVTGFVSTQKMYLILNAQKAASHLFITVIPCSSRIQWSVVYRPENETGLVDEKEIFQNNSRRDIKMGDVYTGRDIYTSEIPHATTGLYILRVVALDKSTFIQMYVTLDPGGPYELTIKQDAYIKLKTKPRRNQLSVRWDHSLVNPQITHYCLVVNTQKHYSTFCEAQQDKFHTVPRSNAATFYRSNERYLGNKRELHNLNEIVCVQMKTSAILNNLVHGTTYYIDLFAINNRTVLTVPYGQATVTYNTTVRQLTLRDGVPLGVNLKKRDGKASFHFKVNKRTKELHFYVMTCGGFVNAEVISRNKTIVPRRLVKSYKRIKIYRPIFGHKYILKITTVNKDELSWTSKVETFATMNPRKRFPLPEIPDDPVVYEYESLRRCDSVTIGWVPVTNQAHTRYCVYVSEDNNPDRDMITDQCFIQDIMRRNHYLTKNCTTIAISNPNSVLLTNHYIPALQPGKSYKIQVTGKKILGKILSYNLLRVTTKYICN